MRYAARLSQGSAGWVVTVYELTDAGSLTGRRVGSWLTETWPDQPPPDKEVATLLAGAGWAVGGWHRVQVGTGAVWWAELVPEGWS